LLGREEEEEKEKKKQKDWLERTYCWRFGTREEEEGGGEGKGEVEAGLPPFDADLGRGSSAPSPPPKL
jgi:hypothetical protein